MSGDAALQSMIDRVTALGNVPELAKIAAQP